MPPSRPESAKGSLARHPNDGARFRVLREHLGLDVEWVASKLGVTERTVRRWEACDWPVPQGAVALLDDLHDQAHAAAAELSTCAAITIPRGASPAVGDTPPRWTRHVAGFVLDLNPGIRIDYEPGSAAEPDTTGPAVGVTLPSGLQNHLNERRVET